MFSIFFTGRVDISSREFRRSLSSSLRRRLAFVGGDPDEGKDPFQVGRVLEDRRNPEQQRSSASHHWISFKRWLYSLLY